MWLGGLVLRRLIIILHTSWRSVGVGQTFLPLILALSTVAQLQVEYPPALYRCGRQSLREQVISLSARFMGQLLSPFLFHGRVGGIEALL